MSKYSKLATEIINLIGGKDNVVGLKHCVTRLRFELKSEDIAKNDAIKNIDGVISVVQSNGQYQIVIGNHVDDVYYEVIKQLGFSGKTETDNATKKTGVMAIIEYVGNSIMPLLNIASASGLLKVFNILAIALGLYTVNSGIFVLIDGISNAIMLFLPIFIGYNASQHLKGDPNFGLLVGAILCYPGLQGAKLDLFGYAVSTTITSTFLPVLLTISLAVPLEKKLREKLPPAIRSIVAPLIVLVTVLPIGYALFGPIGNQITVWLAYGLNFIFSFSPLISGLILGGVWQLLVIIGVHGLLILPALLLLLSGVASPIVAIAGLVSFSQTATLLAITLKSKDVTLKKLSLTSFMSGLVGVTEPGLYGVTQPRKKIFVISCIGGAISGLSAGYLGLTAYTMTGLGIFGLLGLVNPLKPDFLPILIVLAISVTVPFILTLIVFKDDKTVGGKTETEKYEKREVIASPLTGMIKPLSDSKDEAFSSGLLGKGVVIIPQTGKVFAPFDGQIMVMFPTKHAIGILSDNGCEVLIHIGIDTVNLEGRLFESHVNQGDKVKKGDLLVSFDLTELLKEGIIMDSPIIITNTPDYPEVSVVNEKHIKAGSDLIVVSRM